MEVGDEELGIAIVGGGICGLATALALHRKGFTSVVLERSESLRATGGGITIRANGWRALDELGVASKLRQTALPLQGARDIYLHNGKQQKISYGGGEARCLKRSDLITTLAESLPVGTIRLGCQAISVKLDSLTSYPTLQLHNGSTIKAKVVIGCDGTKSVVADFIGVKPSKPFMLSEVRGFTVYADGHNFGNEFVQVKGDKNTIGRLPVHENLVYWFVTHQVHGRQDPSKVSKDPELIRQFTLQSILEEFPSEMVDMIRKSELESVSQVRLRYRPPWEILVQNFRKGSVTVAGDAMHVMGPFIGQGGAAGIEDAIVIARSLAPALAKNHYKKWSGRNGMMVEVGEAFDKKGFTSVVLERSESLRATGGGIVIRANGWRALDELGVASKLRQTAQPLQGVREIYLNDGKQREMAYGGWEARCLKRSDLIATLAESLPVGTIRLGCQAISVKLDSLTSHPTLQLHNGSTIKAKVLIGCDGTKSVVADFVGVKPSKPFMLAGVRGFTVYPGGHNFGNELVMVKGDKKTIGRIPVHDNLVSWFVTHQVHGRQDPSEFSKDPELIRQLTLQLIEEFPSEMVDMIRKSDLESVSHVLLRYRPPWEILVEKFRKGSVTVAGDAMHVMGPFLGQGGSAGIEDAIVIARSLAPTLAKNYDRRSSGRNGMMVEVGEALDKYVKERRMRLVMLSTQTYLLGMLQQNPGPMLKFVCLILLATLFSDVTRHTRYDCGRL
ncbi:zeaxanthin epoxidase [Pyrus ussuriensis x Pyrus communis]|uniref:Zeaxanthin epoxidase n=1 Tax=Pyrus ussuriensis x Pyrus communis TaxID=2448454 RepID=A0A5N5FJW9_9ROSA|nr:zeaxanthin epoxidase [Pyrus ussuriensis x Pyrus communis]